MIVYVLYREGVPKHALTNKAAAEIILSSWELNGDKDVYLRRVDTIPEAATTVTVPTRFHVDMSVIIDDIN